MDDILNDFTTRVNIGTQLHDNDAFYEYVTFVRQGWRCEFFQRGCAVCYGVIGAYEMYGEVHLEGTLFDDTTTTTTERRDPHYVTISVCYHRACKSNLCDHIIKEYLSSSSNSKNPTARFERITLVHLMRTKMTCVWDGRSNAYFLLKPKLPPLVQHHNAKSSHASQIKKQF